MFYVVKADIHVDFDANLDVGVERCGVIQMKRRAGATVVMI